MKNPDLAHRWYVKLKGRRHINVFLRNIVHFEHKKPGKFSVTLKKQKLVLQQYEYELLKDAVESNIEFGNVSLVEKVEKQ